MGGRCRALDQPKMNNLSSMPLHDTSDSPSAEITGLLNPSLSDDKHDQMSSDIGLDFGESSKFDPESVLGSSYSLGRESDVNDDLDLSITPNFETALSCSPPTCFDSASTSSTAAPSRIFTTGSKSGGPSISVSSASSSSPGFQILNPIQGTPAVVLGNVTAESLVSAVLNAKKTEGPPTNANSVSVTPAAAGVWVLNTPPINPELLKLVKPVPIATGVQQPSTVEERTQQNVATAQTETGHFETVTVSAESILQTGTYGVLKSTDAKEALLTTFLKLEDILVKQSSGSSTSGPDKQKYGANTKTEKKSFSKLEGSESNSFSELFTLQDLPPNETVTQTKMSDISLTNVTTLAPEQPILQCSSSEEYQEDETTTDLLPPEKPAKAILKSVEVKKCPPPTLIIEGLSEDSQLVKTLPSQKVPILPKGSQDTKLVPITSEQTSTPVVVHFIRGSSNKEILYCQNIETTLTEDLGQEMMEANVQDSTDEEMEESDMQRNPENNTKSAEVVPTVVRPRKKYQRQEKLKEYKCDLCNAKFDLIGNYTRHRKIHKIDTENSKHKCNICNRAFLQRCDMKRHMLIHTKQEPHRCPTCGKGYIRKSDLVVHMRFHNKERPYQCPDCPKAYYQSGDLKRHKRNTHSNEGMLSCGHCQRRYASEKTLIHHMQSQHKDIILKSLQQKLSENNKNMETS